MGRPALKAVLLDIDGTLLQSNDAHADAWVEALRRHGHVVAWDRVRPLIGKGGDKLLEELVGFDDESEEGQRIANARREIFTTQHLRALQPTTGARDLLLRLRDRGLLRIVATSATGEELDGLLKQAGVDDLIDNASSSGDADDSKPDPDIVVAALEKAGIEADEAVMLGDTPYDIDAAAAAGVDTIALRCGGWWNDEALERAVAIYDDPAALLADFAASPLRSRADAAD